MKHAIRSTHRPRRHRVRLAPVGHAASRHDVTLGVAGRANAAASIAALGKVAVVGLGGDRARRRD